MKLSFDVAEELEKRLAAKETLLGFAQYTKWDWQTGEHHRKICDRLEAIERGDIDRLLILAPPRHGKSELASRRFPIWYLGRNPDRQIIQAAHTSQFAADLGRDVRDIFGTEEYKAVFATQLHPASRAADRWQTLQGGRYFAVGIGGAVVGRGAHLALIDDPIASFMEAHSQTARDHMWDWYTSEFYTRLMPRAAIVVCLTHWHEDDLAGRLMQGDDTWEVLKLPALTDEKALWPEWYDEDALKRIRDQASSLQWEAAYMQNPQPETGTFFERDWFRRYTDKPSALNIYITTDFAVTEGGGDYTEFGVWGVDSNDDLYCLDWWHGQKTVDVWIDKLLDLIAEWKPYVVWSESGPIRRSVEPFLNKRCNERRIYAHFEWITRTADKTAMARSFQGRCSMGKVYFPNTDWADRVINQCVAFPAGKHDDAVDVAALIGLALGNTHASRLPEPEKKTKWDRWTKAFDKLDDDEISIATM